MDGFLGFPGKPERTGTGSGKASGTEFGITVTYRVPSKPARECISSWEACAGAIGLGYIGGKEQLNFPDLNEALNFPVCSHNRKSHTFNLERCQ